jgi:hypothetical protein
MFSSCCVRNKSDSCEEEKAVDLRGTLTDSGYSAKLVG